MQQNLFENNKLESKVYQAKSRICRC